MKSLFLVLIFFSTPLFAAQLVGVGIPPIAFLVEQIGGEHVKTITAMGEGQNPHSFNITPKTVIQLSKAKLYFSIDFPFEHKIERTIARSGKTRIIDLRKGISTLENTHDHNHHGNHSTDDPHVWTTTENLEIISNNILSGLSKAFPRHEKDFAYNHSLLEQKIVFVRAKLKKRLTPELCKTIMVYHPSIKYLASSYGVKLLSVEFDGKRPTPKQLNNVIKEGKRYGIKNVLIDSQLDPKSISPITSALGGNPISYNVLKKDVLENLLSIAEIMVKGAGKR